MKKLASFLIMSVIAVFAFANISVYDVQYTTSSDGVSPYYGQEVVVEGIVVAVNWNSGNQGSFFISDEDGGPWSGVFIYDPSGDYGFDVSLGDMVAVSGLVDEYYGMTEVKSLTDVEVLSSGNPLPDPYAVSTGELASSEAYEGCLVCVNNVTVTAAPDDHGQWYVDDYQRSTCQIDDSFFYLDSVEPPIVINAGDTFARIIGCVDYSYDEYGLQPRTAADIMTEVSVNDITTPRAVAGIANYPNPFNPHTTIVFSLPEAGSADVAIYNTRGQLVKSFASQNYTAGEHRVEWDGTDNKGIQVSSGSYVCKIGGRYTAVKKMILLK